MGYVVPLGLIHIDTGVEPLHEIGPERVERVLRLLDDEAAVGGDQPVLALCEKHSARSFSKHGNDRISGTIA